MAVALRARALTAALGMLFLGALLLLTEARDLSATSRLLRLSFDESAFQTGDLVFRRGSSLLSRAVLSADGAIPYSHVGVVNRENDKIRVIHVEPGDRPGRLNTVAIDSLADFLAPGKASAAAVYRLRSDVADRAPAAVLAASGYAARRVPFDDAFDLATDDTLYCTELVWRSYRMAGLDLVDGRFDHLDMPIGKDIYILPSSLAGSRYLTLVRTFNDSES